MSGFGVVITSGAAEKAPLVIDLRLEDELESEPRLCNELVALVTIEPCCTRLETIVIVVGACDFDFGA